jgi:tripartite-type tricarboxylate transporter receptor subunit TctC
LVVKIFLAMFAFAFGVLQSTVQAEDYPLKPIRVIVPFPAGSSSDVQARQIAQKLFEQMGQQVIVDNRPGANGILGAQVVAKAKPDGYTLLQATSHVIAVNPHLNKNPGFDALGDFTTITITGSTPALLVVSAKAVYKTVRDLLDAAKGAPGKLTFASSGEGSAQHIMGERLMQLASLQLVHIPYKGETQALQDLIAGEIHFAFGFPAGTLPHVRSGALRVLALTGDKRSPVFPDIPTLAESGVPGYNELTYGVYLAPRATPAAIIKKLNAEFRAALLSLKREIAERGGLIIANSPEEAAALVSAEFSRYGKVVKDLGLKPQ